MGRQQAGSQAGRVGNRRVVRQAGFGNRVRQQAGVAGFVLPHATNKWLSLGPSDTGHG